MATQKGTLGKVFGIPGTTTLTWDSKTYETIRTYNYSIEKDTNETRDNDGDVANITYYNTRERLTVDIIVTDNTSQANALIDFNAMPAPGDEVEITSTSGDSQIDSAGDGSDNWLVESANKVATQDDAATISINLIRYTGIDLDTVS